MPERFTREAHEVVVGAQREARELRSDRIGCEHLLLGLLAGSGTAAAALARHGLTHASVSADVARLGGEELDAAALTSVGIDLDAVRSSVEASFGPGALDRAGARPARRGHLPFTPQAEQALEQALREAIALRSRRITDGHLLLGVLRDGNGPAVGVLRERGVDLAALRSELELALAG